MKREWRYKRDEEGRPRRFLSHREALLWAVRRVGLYFAFLLVPPSILSVVGGVGRGIARTGEPPGWEHVGGLALVLLLACSCWLLLAGIYYLYIVLAGGVMDRDARQRYHGEREARRGAGPSAYGRP